MGNLYEIFPVAFIVIGVVIGLLSAAVFGFAFYVGVLWAIDRYQGWSRRKQPMATSMSREEILANRQEAAIKRRVAIRIENAVLNKERITPRVPIEWDGIRK